MRTSKQLWYSLHPCWDDKRRLCFNSETLLLPAHVFVLLIGIDEQDQYEDRVSLPHSQIRQPGISLKHPESLRYASRQRKIRPRGLCRPSVDCSISCTVQRMNEMSDVCMVNRTGCGFVVTNELQWGASCATLGVICTWLVSSIKLGVFTAHSKTRWELWVFGWANWNSHSDVSMDTCSII